MNSMTAFGDCVDTSPLDPSKHVNFVQGMVLGTDDFRQEFAWHAGRHAAIARDLAGYGTVSGLPISIDGNGTDAPQVAVDSGLAVTRTGQFARITRRQCANIASWLGRDENRSRLHDEMLGSPGMRGVRVYVRLKYTDCLLDPVPIPGEPCRSEDEAMAASRIADSWKLSLSLEPPAQHEENAVRELVHWLKRIPLVEHLAATPKDVVAALRTAAADVITAQPRPIEIVLADPPADLFIARADLCECLRAVLLWWTTELRPRAQDQFATGATGCGCSGDVSGSPPSTAVPETDVLLAELWVPVRDAPAGGLMLDTSADVEVHEENRPYLLHLRMVQELVQCGPDIAGGSSLGTFANILAVDATALLLWVHHPAEVELSSDGALAIDVNDVSVPHFVVNEIAGAPNVFEIQLSGSLPAALRRGDRVVFSFDLGLVREKASGRSLRAALDDTTAQYIDRSHDLIVVRSIVGALSLDDLDDVDTAGAVAADVLTWQDGLWKPASVPRQLDDLADVDVAGVSQADGEVLTLRGGRWSPEPIQFPPHTHALRDLSDVDAPAPSNGEFLRFDGGRWHPAGVAVPTKLDDLGDVATAGAVDGDVLTFRGGTWEPGHVAPASPTPVHSGTVNFKQVAAGTATWFGPFPHGFKDRVVMIRLALVRAEGPDFEIAEDTDTISAPAPAPPPSAVPGMLVGYAQKDTEFFILLKDRRAPKDGPPARYVVRWFAVPVTKDTGPADAKPLDVKAFVGSEAGKQIVNSIIASEVASGNTAIATVAASFAVSAEQLAPILKVLHINTKNGQILPVG